MLSELPVFTGVSITCDSCQDSSLPLRMTAAEGGERIIRHAFRTAGIYRRFCQLRFLPRFFAFAQNDCRGRRKKSFPCFLDYRYLLEFRSLAILTEILRCAQNDLSGEEKESFGTLSELPVFTGVPGHLRFLQRFFAGAQNDRSGEEKESFGMFSRLSVFSRVSVTCGTTRDY